MSRRRYKSYKKRAPRSRSRGRGGKKMNLRWVIILLLVIAGGIIVIKQVGKDPKQDVSKTDKEKLEDLLGHNGGGKDVLPPSPGGDNVDPDGLRRHVLPPVGGGITSDDTKTLIKKVNADYEAGKFIAARNMLNRILHDRPLSNKDRAEVKRWLTKLSDEWLFSDMVLKDDTLTGTYKVGSGEHPAVFCKKYKIPYQILLDINGIKDERRVPLGNMKVVKGPFRVVIQLSKFNMDLYLQDQYVKSYDIGIGKPGAKTTTPTGKWRLERNGKSDTGPSWPNKETGKMVLASDPEYPLGARWIPIECLEGDGVGRTGFALHGTNDPKSIGTRCSLGCIRMHDKDVIEVYNMLASGISMVTIVD